MRFGTILTADSRALPAALHRAGVDCQNSRFLNSFGSFWTDSDRILDFYIVLGRFGTILTADSRALPLRSTARESTVRILDF